MDLGHGYQVVLVVFVDVEDGVAFPFDVNCGREVGFGRNMALKSNSVFVVPDIAGCHWGMMASLSVQPCWQITYNLPDLLCHQIGRPGLVNPFAQEDFSKKWIQWLHALLPSVLILITMLLPERTQKPFQNQQCTLLRVWFARRSNKKTWTFCPV